MSNFRARFQAIDWTSTDAAILCSSAASVAFGIAAFAVRTPIRAHETLLMLSIGQAAVVFLQSLQRAGFLPQKPDSDVQDLHITR